MAPSPQKDSSMDYFYTHRRQVSSQSRSKLPLGKQSTAKLNKDLLLTDGEQDVIDDPEARTQNLMSARPKKQSLNAAKMSQTSATFFVTRNTRKFEAPGNTFMSSKPSVERITSTKRKTLGAKTTS